MFNYNLAHLHLMKWLMLSFIYESSCALETQFEIRPFLWNLVSLFGRRGFVDRSNLYCLIIFTWPLLDFSLKGVEGWFVDRELFGVDSWGIRGKTKLIAFAFFELWTFLDGDPFNYFYEDWHEIYSSVNCLVEMLLMIRATVRCSFVSHCVDEMFEAEKDPWPCICRESWYFVDDVEFSDVKIILSLTLQYVNKLFICQGCWCLQFLECSDVVEMVIEFLCSRCGFIINDKTFVWRLFSKAYFFQ